MFIVLRYREKAPSSYPNWIEIPVNPPDARFSQIFNLQAKTVYEFQVIGTNEYGDGMFSEIIQASTKGNTFLSPLDERWDILSRIYQESHQFIKVWENETSRPEHVSQSLLS